jgi:hypothetical protein
MRSKNRKTRALCRENSVCIALLSPAAIDATKASSESVLGAGRQILSATEIA